MPIDVTLEQVTIIKSILKKYFSSNTEIWIFGSRANGKPKKFSDFDIVINDHKPITLAIFAALNHDFDESNCHLKLTLWIGIRLLHLFRN